MRNITNKDMKKFFTNFGLSLAIGLNIFLLATAGHSKSSPDFMGVVTVVAIIGCIIWIICLVGSGIDSLIN